MDKFFIIEISIIASKKLYHTVLKNSTQIRKYIIFGYKQKNTTEGFTIGGVNY